MKSSDRALKRTSIDLDAGFGFYRGRVALAAMLRVLGVGRGDKVMIPGYSCSALAEGVFATGAIPIYVDIEECGYNICATDAANKFEDGVKALVVQHTYGIPANMDLLCEFARDHEIPIVEDCCHTLSTRWRGQFVGTFGSGAFYSFEAGKPVTTGIGGWGQMYSDVHLEGFISEYENYITPSFVAQFRIKLMKTAINLFYRPATYWPVKRLYNRLQKFGLLDKTFNEIDDADEDEALSEESLVEFSTRLGGIQQRNLYSAISGYKEALSQRRELVSYALERFCEKEFQGVPVLPEYCDAVLMRVPVLVEDKRATLALAERYRVELSDNYISPVHPYQGRELQKVKYQLGSCPRAEHVSTRAVSVPIVARTRKDDIDNAIDLLEQCR